MDYSTPNTRTVSWEHSGITFLDRNRIIARVLFPVSCQGPCDGLIGSPQRSRWEAIRESWVEHAMLPEGAYFPRGLERCDYSQSFILAVR